MARRCRRGGIRALKAHIADLPETRLKFLPGDATKAASKREAGMTESFDPASDGAQMSFAKDMNCEDYQQTDRILSSQSPCGSPHDEMISVGQHQASELRMTPTLHEIGAGEFPPAFKVLPRVARIFDRRNSAWDVLLTMSPSDDTTFRESVRLPVAPVPADRIRARQPDRDAPEPRPDLMALLEAELERFITSRWAGWRRPRSTDSEPMCGGAGRTTRGMRAWRPRGTRSIPVRGASGPATGLPRSWWTSRTPIASGCSIT